MNALYRQGNYGQTADLARELAAENNPLGAYALGVMLKSGTIGTQDLAAARKQFVTSARLGDSFGALEAARMLSRAPADRRISTALRRLPLRGAQRQCGCRCRAGALEYERSARPHDLPGQ